MEPFLLTSKSLPGHVAVGLTLSPLDSRLLQAGALWSDSEQSDDVRGLTAPNIARISPPEQNNGICCVTPSHTYQEAVELGICVL